MDLGIAGKSALVCGASKGLGFGCAQALVREGVNVLIVARGAEALEAAVAQLMADSARPASAHSAIGCRRYHHSCGTPGGICAATRI